MNLQQPCLLRHVKSYASIHVQKSSNKNPAMIFVTLKDSLLTDSPIIIIIHSSCFVGHVGVLTFYKNNRCTIPITCHLSCLIWTCMDNSLNVGIVTNVSRHTE